MGKSGCGKSTLINYLNGNIMKEDEIGEYKLKVIVAENEIMKIGHEKKSETIFIKGI